MFRLICLNLHHFIEFDMHWLRMLRFASHSHQVITLHKLLQMLRFASHSRPVFVLMSPPHFRPVIVLLALNAHASLHSAFLFNHRVAKQSIQRYSSHRVV